jgi:DNA-binding transcriptional LysR family regulator
MPGLALRALDPPLERRVFVAARAGSEQHPPIRALIDALG